MNSLFGIGNPLESSPLLSFDDNVLRRIFNLSGSLSTVALVCKQFKTLASREAKEIRQKQIFAYGFELVNTALSSLNLEEKSTIAKIDALFHRAKQHSAKYQNTPLDAAHLRPYDSAHLTAEMSAVAEADSLQCLWEQSLDTFPEDLMEKLNAHALSTDPYHLIEELKSLFQTYREELLFIETLCLKECCLKVLPKEIGLFTNLKSLDLSHNELVKFPNEIFCLEHLEDLDLSHNRIMDLPIEIGQLKSLISLQLLGNELEELPDEICNLAQLQTLGVEINALAELPERIGALSALKCLRLDENCLEALPSSLGDLKCLEKLYLYKNQIQSLPPSMINLSSLRLLSAPCNLLTELPDEIGALSSLEILMLDGNCLRALPASISQLSNLRELYLSDNQILEFPVLPQLKYLGFEDNPCEYHPILTPLEQKWEGRSQFDFIYSLLGDDKAKECIDGEFYEKYGPRVFDEGKHGGDVEPGYLSSMLNLFAFLKQNWQSRLNVSFYLQMHKVACAHFQGETTGTLIDQEDVGVFRNDIVRVRFSSLKYGISEAGREEFYKLNDSVAHILGTSFSIGEIVDLTPSSPDFVPNTGRMMRIDFQFLTRQEMRILFNLFISQFHSEMLQASSLEAGESAIGKLFQRLEWLHPPKDGSTRTNVALMNFLLSKYGLSPVLMKFFCWSSAHSFPEWMEYLSESRQQWWREVQRLQNSNQMQVEVEDDNLLAPMHEIAEDDGLADLMPMSLE